MPQVLAEKPDQWRLVYTPRHYGKPPVLVVERSEGKDALGQTKWGKIIWDTSQGWPEYKEGSTAPETFILWMIEYFHLDKEPQPNATPTLTPSLGTPPTRLNDGVGKTSTPKYGDPETD